jgi:SRSO17 transposase
MEIQTVTKNALGGKNQEKLEAYLEDIGAILRYPERRASFALYALGLLSEGERKSVEPIAARAAGTTLPSVSAITTESATFYTVPNGMTSPYVAMAFGSR